MKEKNLDSRCAKCNGKWVYSYSTVRNNPNKVKIRQCDHCKRKEVFIHHPSYKEGDWIPYNG